jgi:hypothetical protein
VNVERGFLRLTAVVSGVILIAGIMLGRIVGVGVVVFFVALPWLIFFVLRWIFRGFGSP